MSTYHEPDPAGKSRQQRRADLRAMAKAADRWEKHGCARCGDRQTITSNHCIRLGRSIDGWK